MTHSFIQFSPRIYTEDEILERARSFFQKFNQRRSIRQFSRKPVPREVIENLIKTAGTAPSGANKQPWTFVVVSDPELKHKIRITAEKVEKGFYKQRISEEWRQDLLPLGTGWHKPFLEDAPYLIVVFQQNYRIDEQGRKRKHYYVIKSIGIAVGFLIMAIHNAGLVTVPHTPSPMGFLREILDRPKNEKVFAILPVGYPIENVQVPDIKRKKLSDILVWK
ncbi:MAG: nitroreductase family protein [Candidatus Hodarchaeota archaeon]